VEHQWSEAVVSAPIPATSEPETWSMSAIGPPVVGPVQLDRSATPGPNACSPNIPRGRSETALVGAGFTRSAHTTDRTAETTSRPAVGGCDADETEWRNASPHPGRRCAWVSVTASCS